MPVTTLKHVTEKLGISGDTKVRYYVRAGKAIIEVALNASDRDIELASVQDVSEEFLTEEELRYYLNLEEL